MFAHALAFLAFSGISLSQILHNQLPIGSSFGLPENATYDYVIVGGGTAGNVLAYRLAEDGRYSVAVIEAGSFYELDSGNRSVIPGYVGYSNSLIDWGFVTTPQTTLVNQIQPYPRGKCLGGSSSRNTFIYQRPTVGAMQKWADEVGDQSWTWNQTLKYFKRGTTFTPPTRARPANSTPAYDDSSAFGSGPLQVSYSNFVFGTASWAMRALSRTNGSAVAEGGFQSGSLLGYNYIPATLKPEVFERSSSQSSYLALALQRRTQLTVYTHTLAKRIVFSTNKTATGVEVESAGVAFRIDATKEVIVSAGAFQSPQLLMVSGIGPEKILTDLSIPVVQDLRGVGQNLQDTPFCGISFEVDLETYSTYQNNATRTAEAVAAYNANHTGYLSAPSIDVIAFEKLVDLPGTNISSGTRQALAGLPKDWPDAEILTYATYLGPSLGVPPPDKKNYAEFVTGLLAPLSKGSVSINSSDTADAPLINPQWLTEPTDQEIAVAAIRRMRQVLANMYPIAGKEAFPGANVTLYDDLLNVVRGQVGSFYHASATNKKGRANDSMAVVDSRARVFGVDKLRVVDASSFPFLPPGQPQATIYMLAEKIADDVLDG